MVQSELPFLEIPQVPLLWEWKEMCCAWAGSAANRWKSSSINPPPFLVLDADEILVWHEACLPFAVFILLRLELLRYGSYFEL